MVTIKDIALAAGVSPITVSKVLHHHDKRVSPQTVEHIRRMIASMGYVPSMTARSLAGCGVVAQRYRGYCDAMAEFGLPVHNSDMARLNHPPLTTIHQDAAKRGEEAVEMLLQAIETGMHAQPCVFPVSLVQRSSVRKIKEI